jgi:hypothetical protein
MVGGSKKMETKIWLGVVAAGLVVLFVCFVLVFFSLNAVGTTCSITVHRQWVEDDAVVREGALEGKCSEFAGVIVNNEIWLNEKTATDSTLQHELCHVENGVGFENELRCTVLGFKMFSRS